MEKKRLRTRIKKIVMSGLESIARGRNSDAVNEPDYDL